MSEQKKVYRIWHSSKTDGDMAIKEIIKTEEELTKQDYDLFLGDLINTFNKAPERTKMEFIHKVILDGNNTSNNS